MRLFPLAPLVALLACETAADATDASKKAASDAVDASKKLADGAVDASKTAVNAGKKAADAGKDAVDAGKKAVDRTTDAANDALDASKDAAGAAEKWWKDIPDTGELSKQTQAWLETAAKKGERSVENAVVEGESYAPTAVQIGKALNSAVDSDHGFEPIYVKVSDRADADKQIGDMPKVQVVDNLTIGLKRVDAWEGLKQSKERGYLVLWREDDHLVGFVYRSRREIDIEKVAAEAPRLITLVRAAL